MSEKPTANFGEYVMSYELGPRQVIRLTGDISDPIKEAEARGYRRGIREAADKVQSMRTSTTADAARAILALMEPGEKK